jgi:hypothetical protein
MSARFIETIWEMRSEAVVERCPDGLGRVTLTTGVGVERPQHSVAANSGTQFSRPWPTTRPSRKMPHGA